MRRTKTRKDVTANTPAANAGLGVSKLRLFGVAVLCAKVFLVPVIFDPALDMPFVVSKALLSHALACVLAATMVSLLVRFGRPLLVWSPLHIPIAAFVFISAIAAMFAMNSTVALLGTHARMLGLDSILDFAVFYFALVLLIRTRADARAIVASVMSGSVLVVTYEVVQMLGADPFQWSISGVERPFSTLGEATALAQYLTVLAVGTFALGLSVDGQRPYVRLVLLLYSVLLVLASVATGTRSAVVGLGAGGLALLVLAWKGHPSRRARIVTSLASATSLVVLAGLVIATPLGARIASTLDSQSEDDETGVVRLEPSTAGRVELYSIAVNEVRERPFLGYGPDNFTVGVPRYRPEGATAAIRQSLATSAHSWVGYVATSSGLIGLAAFASIALIAYGVALRAGFRAPTVVGASMLSAFLGTGLTTANEFGTEWLFWFSVGVVGSSMSVLPRARRASTLRVSGRETAIAAALTVATIFVTLSAIAAYDASRSAHASQDARLAGMVSRALELGLHATKSDPTRAEYWDTLGLAYVARSGWRDATIAFRHASGLAPHDVRYLNDLAAAQVQLAAGGDASARTPLRDMADQIGRVDPNNPRAQLTRAVVLQFLGDYPEAARAVERALILDPSTNPQIYVSAVQILRGAGRITDAIRVARDGISVFGPTKNSVAVRVELARTLVAAGSPSDALTELDVALTIAPDDSNAQRLRADILAARR